MEFVVRLSRAGLFLMVGLCALARAADANAVKDIGVDEFDKLRAEKTAVVLDVRTKGEFTSKHIPGAVNIDWNSQDFAKQVEPLDKSKVYLVQCATGRRSARAAAKLNELGFKEVYNLKGGITAWEKAGKSTQP